MRIKAKALSAEVEIELPDEKDTLVYQVSGKILPLIDKVKESVIEIEKQLAELNKLQPKQGS